MRPVILPACVVLAVLVLLAPLFLMGQKRARQPKPPVEMHDKASTMQPSVKLLRDGAPIDKAHEQPTARSRR